MFDDNDDDDDNNNKSDEELETQFEIKTFHISHDTILLKFFFGKCVRKWVNILFKFSIKFFKFICFFSVNKYWFCPTDTNLNYIDNDG